MEFEDFAQQCELLVRVVKPFVEGECLLMFASMASAERSLPHGREPAIGAKEVKLKIEPNREEQGACLSADAESHGSPQPPDRR